MTHLFIFGTGGFGREALSCFVDFCKSKQTDYSEHATFIVDDEYYIEDNLMGIPIIKRSDFKSGSGEVVIAIGDPMIRSKVVMSLPRETKYAKLIHPSAVISDWAEIGDGCIVCAGTIITTQIKIGQHAHLNLNSTIGHDCIIGDFFTSSPGVHISGECTIGSNVFIGTNTALREKLQICDNVLIGMASNVLKSILEPGVYIGNPTKKSN